MYRAAGGTPTKGGRGLGLRTEKSEEIGGGHGALHNRPHIESRGITTALSIESASGCRRQGCGETIYAAEFMKKDRVTSEPDQAYLGLDFWRTVHGPSLVLYPYRNRTLQSFEGECKPFEVLDNSPTSRGII